MRFSVNTTMAMFALAMSAVSAVPVDVAVAVTGPDSDSEQISTFYYHAHDTWIARRILRNDCVAFDQFSASAVTQVIVPVGFYCEVFAGTRCSGAFDFFVGNGQVRALIQANRRNLSWRCA